MAPDRVTERHIRGLRSRLSALEGAARVTGKRGDVSRAEAANDALQRALTRSAERADYWQEVLPTQPYMR